MRSLHRGRRQRGAVHWPALGAAVAVTLLSLILVWAFLEWVLPWVMGLQDGALLTLRLALTAAWIAACLALLWRWWQRRRGQTSATRQGQTQGP